MPRPSLLLIDSDARSSRVLEVSLKKAGFTVVTATSAAEALQLALKNPPDLVITETSLPDSDGYELCARLRRDARTTRCGIIFLSADTSADAKVKGINAGADDFLNKPVLVMEIVSRVRGLLERRETEAIARRERPGNLSGALAHMGVVDLLQLMESGSKTGIIHLASDAARSGGFVARGEQRATIYFRDGQVIDASLGKLVGVAAVYRTLMWEDGVFEIEFKPLAREDVVRTTTQAILLEGMRRIDEWSRATEILPPLNAKLAVDFALLTARYRELPEHLRGVVHLFDGKRTLFEVVEEASNDDLEVVTAIVELHRGGVLKPSDRPASTVPATDAATVEAWLSSVPGLSPTGAVSADLPSVLARAMIPASNPSEIIRAADPRLAHDPTEPTLDGTPLGEVPIPLTQPVRERTPIPEPLTEDSVILSRHTVPANRAVPLTSSKPGAPAVSDATPLTTGEIPIPLTNPVQRQLPRLTLQRVTSTVPRPTSAQPEQDPSSPTLDSWTPVAPTLGGGLGSLAGLPADNDPTVRDFSTMQVRTVSPATRAASSAIAAAATVPTSAVPGQSLSAATPATSLAAFTAGKAASTSAIPIKIPSTSTSPGQSLSGLASPSQSLSGLAGTVTPASAHPAAPAQVARPTSAHPATPSASVTQPVAIDANTTIPDGVLGVASPVARELPTPAWPVSAGGEVPRSLALDETERVVRAKGERSPVRGPSLIVAPASPLPSAQPAPHASAEAASVNDTLPPGNATLPAIPPVAVKVEPEVVRTSARPAAIDAAPAAAAQPAIAVEPKAAPKRAAVEDPEDSFFSGTSSGSDDAVEWEGTSNRGRNLLVVGLLVAVAAGVVLAPSLGGKQKVEKAPEAPSKAKLEALAKKPSAQWPAVDESKIQVGAEATKPDQVAPPAKPAEATPTAAVDAGVAAATAQQPATAQATAQQPATAQATAQQPAAAQTAAGTTQPQPATGAAKQAVTAVTKPAETAAAKPAEKAAEKAAEKPAEKPVPVVQEQAPLGKTEAKATAPAGDSGALLGQAEAALKGDKLKEAETKFRAAVAAQPNSAAAHSGLAMALYGLEKDAAATAEAKKAIALDPNSARAHLVVGLIASNRQDIAGAKKAYRRYLELEPKGEYADEVRRFMKAQQ